MGIGLYIHVPFCVRKCQYCAFTSYSVKEGQVSIYIDALCREMGIRAGMLSPEERKVETVYIGGGTPTCLPAEDLGAVFEAFHWHFEIEPGAEISVEANPGTVDGEKLSMLGKFGANRISIGVQACQRELLGLLGRVHTFEEAVSTLYQARDAGFENINLDLIFGIPGQSLEQWQECLNSVADLNPEHISAYGLHLEEGTPLFERVGKRLLEPCPEDLEADMYKCLTDSLKSRGYIHYEISNFALPGRQCRHNLRYWHNLDYLGLGPAAHSFMTGRRFSNETVLQRYAGSISAGVLPECWEEKIDLENEMSETVFLGLRLVKGLDKGEFRRRFGKDIEEVYGDRIGRLAGLGLIEADERRLCLTGKGLMLGNMVFAEFVG
ncbi:MAG: radical SAM family heme chaperone HemW [Bacillota bacterium]